MFPDVRNSLINHPLYKHTILSSELRKTPLGFLDVGARGGVHDIAEPLASQTGILGFEPDKDECNRLSSMKEVVNSWAKFFLLPIGLYNKSGSIPLYFLSANTNHSLLRPNEKYVHRYGMHSKWTMEGETEVPVDTLDNVLESLLPLDYFPAEFIKLDTQGTEYEILEGSPKTLAKQTVCIISEVQFFDIYKDQKLFSDVEQFLKKKGFFFYGFRSFHFRSAKKIDRKKMLSAERAFYADAIFFKDPLTEKDNMLNSRQMIALLASSLLLGYYDFALELLESENFNSFESEKIISTKRFIEALASECFEKNEQETLSLFRKKTLKEGTSSFMEVSKYIHKRRFFGSSDDILNISPLPRTI